jgi:hypothetical protein
MLGETKKQFSLTRAALSTNGRAKRDLRGCSIPVLHSADICNSCVS